MDTSSDTGTLSSGKIVKVEPIFTGESILKTLLLSPSTSKSRNFKYTFHNNSDESNLSVNMTRSRPISFVNIKEEPFDYDDQNSISTTDLQNKFLSRNYNNGLIATTTSMKQVNSFINKFGSELVSTIIVKKEENSPTAKKDVLISVNNKQIQTEVPLPVPVISKDSVTKRVPKIVVRSFAKDISLSTNRDVSVTSSADVNKSVDCNGDVKNAVIASESIKKEVSKLEVTSQEDSNMGYYSEDDSNECIPSLNVEVELQEGDEMISNIDDVYDEGADPLVDKDPLAEVSETGCGIRRGVKGPHNSTSDELKCSICARQFNFKKNMNKHLRHMHGVGRFACAVCPMEFEKRRELILHRDSHAENATAGGGFKCETCGKVIQWYNHFIQHRKTHEAGNLSLTDVKLLRSHKCEVCNKAFRSAANLRVHNRTHTGERPYVCHVCGSSFAQKRIQVDHMNKHTGAKPYACADCGDRFANYITFNVHKRTRHTVHTDTNTFTCAVCGATFIWRSNLVSHMRSHTKERAYSCKICNKTFAHRNSMAYHRRVHAGARPHKCPLCDKSYRTTDHLATHRASAHPASTPSHACDVCSKTFARSGLLRSHKLTHDDGTTHDCGVCGTTFATRSTLARHKRKQHPSTNVPSARQ